jgi:hypothetical protein
MSSMDNEGVDRNLVLGVWHIVDIIGDFCKNPRTVTE